MNVRDFHVGWLRPKHCYTEMLCEKSENKRDIFCAIMMLGRLNLQTK